MCIGSPWREVMLVILVRSLYNRLTQPTMWYRRIWAIAPLAIQSLTCSRRRSWRSGGVEQGIWIQKLIASSSRTSGFLTYSWVTVQYICARYKHSEGAGTCNISDRQDLPNLRGQWSNELLMCWMSHNNGDIPAEWEVVPVSPLLLCVGFPSLQYKRKRETPVQRGLSFPVPSAVSVHEYKMEDFSLCSFGL